MTKWILGLLLLANIVFFAAMRFGGTLTQDADMPSVQTEISPDKIRLMSEVLPAVSAVVVATKPVAPAPAPPSAVAASAPVIILSPLAAAVPVKQCLDWGEFSGNGLTQALAALSELQLGDKIKQHTVEHDRGFWVYIPPQKSQAEVQKKIAQLKQRGISELFVVQEEGKWHNAISLGVFRTEESAQKFLAGLRPKGVKSAVVGERLSKLKFTVFEFAGVDAASADKIRALQKNFPDSEIKISPCN